MRTSAVDIDDDDGDDGEYSAGGIDNEAGMSSFIG